MLTGGDSGITRRPFGTDATLEAFDLHRGVWIDEQRNGITIPVAADRPHAMNGGAEAPVGPAFHQVAGIDHGGALHRRRKQPLALLPHPLPPPHPLLAPPPP